MSLKNPLGDFEITDPLAMRALAHPVRLAALSYLQRHGPATATQLSTEVGASPSVTSWHLRHLAGFGLVTDEPDPGPGTDKRTRWWRAVARGIRFDLPASPEGHAAGRLLRTEMLAEAIDQTGRWLAEVEPDLVDEWSRLASSSNTRVRLTPAELRTIEESIEQMLAPFVHRAESDSPEGARSVRLIRFFLPASADVPRDRGPTATDR